MGLDQCLMRRDTDCDNAIDEDGQKNYGSETHYWRKFNELQGWFERNHGQENCEYTQVTPEIAMKLSTAIMKSVLLDDNRDFEKTEGFFYGNMEADKEQLEKTAKAFAFAAAEMTVDQTIEYYYYCWY